MTDSELFEKRTSTLNVAIFRPTTNCGELPLPTRRLRRLLEAGGLSACIQLNRSAVLLFSTILDTGSLVKLLVVHNLEGWI
ncbi:hypothetical protein SAMN05216226_112115 [Halovenus aranensis]|uniref:Uncharacterized protein n=1 Tax=Halovenus aranensis TaxID=890420 RepID=A0A1G8XXK9_9EURY|nr:hypothetical protein SAMN05216226_112115 [Halovenus aranensis]